MHSNTVKALVYSPTNGSCLSGSGAFADILETMCFDGWFGFVESPERSTLLKAQTGLDRKEVDYITLEWGLVFLRHGVESVASNESLNCIRGTVGAILAAMGYEDPTLKIVDDPRWGCYKLWEGVAARDGYTQEDITQTRAWFRHKFPEHYQA